jgi:hypothetical protein
MPTRQRPGYWLAEMPNEPRGCRGFILRDGRVVMGPNHSAAADMAEQDSPEWWAEIRRTAIRMIRLPDQLCLEFATVPTAAQLFTISQERCKRIVFDVRHPTMVGTIHDGGTLAMADVDQLEDSVRSVFTRWGIAA